MTGHDRTTTVACETGEVTLDDAPGSRAADTAGGWAPPSPGARPAGAGGATGATGAPAPDPAPADEQSFGERVAWMLDKLGVGGVDVPFDTFGEAVRWWFRPLADPLTWKAFASLLGATLLAGPLFAITVAVVTVTTVLILVLVGLLLVPLGFAVVGAFAALGRDLAGWGADEPIAPRPYADPNVAGGGRLLGPVTRRLTDETRWRQLAFVLLDVVVAPMFLVGALLPVSAVTGLLGGLAFLGPLSLVDALVDLSFLQFLLVIPLLGGVARLLVLAARWRRRYAAVLLGPDRESQLEERVEELSVQRDQVLEAVAAERRRIERNLHDGVQQQLVALGIDIGRASRKLDDDPEAARQLLDDARDKVRSSIGELRLIGRGLHPSVLDDRGLDAALSSVVAGAPIPIAVEVDPALEGSGGLSDEVAETAYYVANEAVANMLKYADARVASINVEPDPGLLPAVRVTVHDDGRGGADPSRGSGIAGMRARVEAVDGAFRLDSPPGGPTVVTAVIPRRRAAPSDGADAGAGRSVRSGVRGADGR